MPAVATHYTDCSAFFKVNKFQCQKLSEILMQVIFLYIVTYIYFVHCYLLLLTFTEYYYYEFFLPLQISNLMPVQGLKSYFQHLLVPLTFCHTCNVLYPLLYTNRRFKSPLLRGHQPDFNCGWFNSIVVFYCNTEPAGVCISHDAQLTKVKQIL
jgi:hypothetical protein